MIRAISILLSITLLVWSSFILWGAYQNANKQNTLFQFHPPLMAFGFMVFMTGGLLSVVNKKSQLMHVSLQLIGSICILTGLLVVVLAKSYAGESHFNSTHSVIGLTAVLGLVYQIINGMLKLCNNNGGFVKSHGLSGVGIYLLGVCALLVACSSYLCGNITIPKAPGTYECDSPEINSIRFSITLILPAILVVLLYIKHAKVRVHRYPNLNIYTTI